MVATESYKETPVLITSMQSDDNDNYCVTAWKHFRTDSSFIINTIEVLLTIKILERIMIVLSTGLSSSTW